MADVLRLYDDLNLCNSTRVVPENVLGYVMQSEKKDWHPDCKLIELITELVKSEILLLACLLFASRSTPPELFAEALAISNYAIIALVSDLSLVNCFNNALEEMLAFQSLVTGAKRVQRLMALLARARTEPFRTTQLGWASDSYARCALHFFHTGLLPVPPTRPHFEKPFGHQDWFMMVRNHDPSIVGEAWRELAEAFQRVGKLVTFDWLPTQGTLLALLRYGELPGVLADGKVDIVDRDLDIAVVLPSAKAWFDFCIELTRQLAALTWPGCMLATTLPKFTDSAKARYPLRRGVQSLQCVRTAHSEDERRLRGNLLVDIVWMLPVQPVHTYPTSVACATGSADETAPCQVNLVHLEYHKDDQGGSPLAISRDVSCDGSLCWAGDLMPARLWQEKGRCGAFGESAPCPRHALEHLLMHFGQQHDIVSFALPDLGCSEEWTQKRLMVPDNLRLYCEGLSVRDVAVLRQRRLWLKSRGFLTTNFTGLKWTHCIRTKLLKYCRGFQSTFAAPRRNHTLGHVSDDFANPALNLFVQTFQLNFQW